ncbi:RagB/SusD family nutrient uptake outer membrane protein [Membranihabitans marinus]|uniref:RagB/SusD family nutrient uptake outer membrane protein n=1 Tax=Membranihabitans marinus TaxID=1227546 RepID=UPI001F2E60F4|nr:RagB/SusD family nutrient uptake outer membrane protein [Membranihabitans marinus]
MKNLLYLYILFFLFTSCSTEFLKEEHPVQSTSETFFTSDADAEAAAIGLYEYTRNLYFGRDMVEHFASNFDIFMGDNVTLPRNFYKNSIVPWLTLNFNPENGSVQQAWATTYTTIYRANWIIENLTDNDAISEAVKNKALSEAYFFRGFCYFNLTRYFEEVPIVLEVTNDDNLYPEKSSNEECWNQVFTDFEKSLSLGGLPAPTQNFVDGRINTGVANAIMARAYLYRTEPGSDQYWDKVKEYTSAVENLGAYDLEPIDDFSKYFVYTNGDKWVENREMIWVHGFSYGSTYGGLPFLYDGKNYATLAYMSMPVGYNTGLLKNDKGKSYLVGNGLTGRAYYAASKSLSDLMIDYFNKGDQRTSEYLMYPSFNSYALDGDAVVVKETVDSDSLYQKLVESNGSAGEYIHVKKFEIREFVGENIWDGGFNHSMVFPIIRYGDIMLMRAEAEYHLGNEAEARSYLKYITDRAGFAADYLDQFSGQDLLDEILKQRRVELFMESLRVPDLKRLGQFKSPNIGTFPGSANFEEKFTVLPIPRRELDANPNLVQHSLWR